MGGDALVPVVQFFFVPAGMDVGGPSPFRPLPGPTYFSLSCQRKVGKRKARRDGESLLEFLSQGGRGGKLASLRQPPLFFLPATEIQGAI
jgi:hypothetical protein